MIAVIKANLGTFVIGFCLFSLIIVIIRKMIKNQKKGKCHGCSLECSESFCDNLD